MTPTSFAAAGVAALLALACGTSQSSAGADACEAVASAALAHRSRCEGVDPSSSGAADYKAATKGACLASLQLPGTSATPQALADCAAQEGSLTCTEAYGLPDACRAKPGSLPDGSLCNNDQQCQGRCSSLSGVDGGPLEPPFCGTCTSAPGVGQSCDTAMCGNGTVCVGAPGHAICVLSGSVDVGGACSAGACKYEVARCGGTPGAATCVALGAPGATCVYKGDCQNPLACIAGVCATPLPAGADCHVDGTACADGLSCSVTGAVGTCTPLHLGSPGDPCAQGSPCIIGTCNGLTGKCPTVLADGQPCPTDLSTTCDVNSTCFLGVCTSASTVCR